MKKRKSVTWFFSIFLVIGIGLLVGSFFLLKSFNDFKEIAVEITGKIVQIESYYDSDHELHHKAYVTYTYNGKVYDSVPLNYYSSSMFEGKEIKLLCDPENPGHIKGSTGVSMAGLMLGFMGITFSLAGGLPILFNIKKGVHAKRMLKNGKVLHAVVERIDYDFSYSEYSKNPFVIYCEYRDEYKDITYKFKSDHIWTDPSAIFQPGSYIEVMVDPNDYSNYHVKKEVIEQKIQDYT